MPVHTSPDGETEKKMERGREKERWRKNEDRADREKISTHTPAMENSCIGLSCPEAEEGILTFPSLQATSDPCSLPPSWRLAAAEQDGERRRMRRGRRMTLKEKCEFVLCNVTSQCHITMSIDGGLGECKGKRIVFSFLFSRRCNLQIAALL